MYADMIVRVTIHTALRTDMIKTYDGVNFHKLHDLTLLIHTPAHSAIWIPRLICPSVKHLSIGSVSGYFQEDKAKAVVMWEYIFNRILVC